MSTDIRLYCATAESTIATIKHRSEREYCFAKFPGESYFHLLIDGELHVQRGTEKYCLACALRLGILTADRQYWQRTSSDRQI